MFGTVIAFFEFKDWNNREQFILDLKSPDLATKVKSADKLGDLLEYIEDNKDYEHLVSIIEKALIAALNDEYPAVRKEAAESLRYSKSPDAVKALIVALNDENAGVRKESAGALGRIKDTTAVPPLLIALNDNNIEVRDEAEWALERMGRKPLNKEVVELNKPMSVVTFKGGLVEFSFIRCDYSGQEIRGNRLFTLESRAGFVTDIFNASPLQDEVPKEVIKYRVPPGFDQSVSTVVLQRIPTECIPTYYIDRGLFYDNMFSDLLKVLPSIPLFYRPIALIKTLLQ
ncbi:MAG: HEAT repeat domain-containing protein [Candidatus Schekmanbacteria bacterium]|nr:HEAT repeat domain-containing protein [Candidatus Schekmanbacteria bacterium]